MGLNKTSTRLSVINDPFEIQLESKDDIVIALAGNPNTGKSTVFNNLTGLRQHTGNWPGKTVNNAQGKYIHKDETYILVDLPGTYSILSNSLEEEIARDFICFGKPDVTVVVTDATSLERNLNLALQIMEITEKVIVCVNLMDEAKNKKIHIDLKKLENILGVPVVGTTARNGSGLDKLKEKISEVSKSKINLNPIQINYDKNVEDAIEEISKPIENLLDNKLNTRWTSIRLLEKDILIMKSIKQYINFDLSKDKHLNNKLIEVRESLLEKDLGLIDLKDLIVSSIVKTAEKISKEIVIFEGKSHNLRNEKIDDILTSRLFGIPIMIALLGLIFWITIEGANIPSNLLANGLFFIEDKLSMFFLSINTPLFIHDIFVLGIYRTLAWVVSVMLVPMASKHLLCVWDLDVMQRELFLVG